MEAAEENRTGTASVRKQVSSLDTEDMMARGNIKPGTVEENQPNSKYKYHQRAKMAKDR